MFNFEFWPFFPLKKFIEFMKKSFKNFATVRNYAQEKKGCP
jgi:hypothetical protein